MSDYSNAVRNLAAKMPSVWKTEHRIKAAKHIVDSNAQYEVTSRINEFALDAALPQSSRSPGQMPVMSNMSAALPANLTSQGGTAADQITPEHIADFVGTSYHKFGTNYASCCIVDAHNGNNGEAQDQGSFVRLPRGWGASGSELTSPNQSNSGTFAEREEAWRGQNYGQPGWVGGPPMSSATRPGNSDRAARDQRRPFDARQNRMGGRDRRMAGDAALPQQSFLDRWPEARLIRFSANGRY
jgi:hypothetical protein